MSRLGLGLLFLALHLPVWAQSDSREAQVQAVSRYNEWLTLLQSEIRGKWHPPVYTPGFFSLPGERPTYRTVLFLIIDRLGRLKGAYLKETSSSTEADQAAFKAVQEAVLPAFLPEMLGEDSTLSFNFDTNIISSTQETERLNALDQQNRLTVLQCIRKFREQVSDASDTYLRTPSAEIAEAFAGSMLHAGYWNLAGDTLPRLVTKFPTLDLKIKALRAAYHQGNLNAAQQSMVQLEQFLDASTNQEREVVLYQFGGDYYLYRGYILFEVGQKAAALTAWETGDKYARPLQQEQLRLLGELVKQEGKVSVAWREAVATLESRRKKSCPNTDPISYGLQGKLGQLYRQALRP